MRVNFFISLLVAGILHTIFEMDSMSVNSKRAAAGAILLVGFAGYAVYVYNFGLPGEYGMPAHACVCVYVT